MFIVKVKKGLLYLICGLILTSAETGCRAKSCPAYGDEPPKRGIFKKKKKKTRNGLFSRKQRRYF